MENNNGWSFTAEMTVADNPAEQRKKKAEALCARKCGKTESSALAMLLGLMRRKPRIPRKTKKLLGKLKMKFNGTGYDCSITFKVPTLTGNRNRFNKYCQKRGITSAMIPLNDGKVIQIGQ